MLDLACTLAGFNRQYGRLLVADLADADLADQPTPGATHPAWVLGHLAIAADFALALLGAAATSPPEWRALFGPGSPVLADRAAYPSKAELVAAVEAGQDRLLAAARAAPPELLSRPQPGPFYREDFATVGELVAHLMTTHASLHLGQIAAWRRARGLPAALGI